MEPLATPAQLAERMGTPPSDPARADAALTDASATVRAATGQDFTRAATDSILRARCGEVRLPQRPVLEVTAVTDTAGAEVAWWEWDQLDRLRLDPGYPVVVVSYDHGYDVIPDDIVAVTCSVAARALATPPEDAGVQSRSITNYSESFGAVGAAGPAGLFNDERAVLSRYQRRGSSARTGL